MDRAVKVTEETLAIITEANDGVTPRIEERTTYFVTLDDPNMYNMILSEKDFHDNFKFTGPELEHQFTEVTGL